jgi:hypothetical protein
MQTFGVTEIQWDGGPTYSIHPHSKRSLPIDLADLTYIPQLKKLPELYIEFPAEGYRRPVHVPVKFTVDGKPFPERITIEFPLRHEESDWL